MCEPAARSRGGNLIREQRLDLPAMAVAHVDRQEVKQ